MGISDLKISRNTFQNFDREGNPDISGLIKPDFIIDENNTLKDELEGQQKDSQSLMQFKYIYDICEVSTER
mgnify:CR=1 FL=1